MTPNPYPKKFPVTHWMKVDIFCNFIFFIHCTITKCSMTCYRVLLICQNITVGKRWKLLPATVSKIFILRSSSSSEVLFNVLWNDFVKMRNEIDHDFDINLVSDIFQWRFEILSRMNAVHIFPKVYSNFHSFSDNVHSVKNILSEDKWHLYFSGCNCWHLKILSERFAGGKATGKSLQIFWCYIRSVQWQASCRQWWLTKQLKLRLCTYGKGLASKFAGKG